MCLWRALAVPQIDYLVGETMLAGVIAVVVASPFLYYALIKGGQPHELPEIANEYGLDLLNPLFPTNVTWLFNNTFAGIASTFEGGNIAEADGFLSLPIIIAFVLWLISARRRLLAQLVGIVAVLSFVASLGAHLHVEGSSTIPLPYDLIRHLPVVRLLTPSRIAMYTALAVAVGVAAWLAEARGSPKMRAARWALVCSAWCSCSRTSARATGARCRRTRRSSARASTRGTSTAATTCS